MPRVQRWTALVLATLVFGVAPQAQGSGFYNMPTSLQQCLGVGFGPGYHAPMLLSPSWKARIASQPLRRIPAPLPPLASCFGAPSVWESASVSHEHPGPMRASPVGYQPTYAAPAESGPVGAGAVFSRHVLSGPGSPAAETVPTPRPE